MSREYKMEEIMDLLEEGFEPKSLVAELGISIEYVNECTMQLVAKKKLSEKADISSDKKSIIKSLYTQQRKKQKEKTDWKEQIIVEKMRTRYNKLLLEDGTIAIKKLSKKQKQLIELIKNKIDKAEDFEKLKEIEQMISSEDNNGKLDFLNVKLRQKRSQIEQKEIMQKYRNNMSPEIMQIIQSIIKGACDYELAMMIIEEQTKQKVQNKPKTKFSLTQEQEVQQTMIQIRKEIEKNPREYIIENPERTIEILRQFSPKSPELAIKTVIENLVGRGEFAEAKRLCNLYMQKDKDDLYDYILALKKRVRNNEVAKFVTEFLERETTEEEEITFIQVLREKIIKERIKASSVILGEGKESRRTITLANICGEELLEYERN